MAQRCRSDTTSAPDDGNYLRRPLGNRRNYRPDHSDLAPFNQRACQSGLPPSDFWVLFLLLAVIILGIGCVVNSYLYDKSGATIILLGGWVRGLFSFDYQAWQNILLVPVGKKGHIFVGLIIFLIVPFTRLVHIWSGYLSVFYLIRPATDHACQ